MFTHVNGVPLSTPELRPIFATMADLDLPIWVHPIRGAHSPEYSSETISEDEIWFMFGWPYETTACMTRLIFSGLFDEYPDIKIITHHMGGMIPFFSGKIKLGFSQIFFGTHDVNPVAQAKFVHWRTSIPGVTTCFNSAAVNGELHALRCGHEFFGTQHSIFATDAPFDAEKGYGLIRDTIAAIDALELTVADRHAILSGNARKLLKMN